MDRKLENEKRLQEIRAEEKKKRNVVKVGKPIMQQREKPPVKKVEVKKKVLTDD